MIWFGKSFIKFCKSFINLIKLVSTRTMPLCQGMIYKSGDLDWLSKSKVSKSAHRLRAGQWRMSSQGLQLWCCLSCFWWNFWLFHCYNAKYIAGLSASVPLIPSVVDCLQSSSMSIDSSVCPWTKLKKWLIYYACVFERLHVLIFYCDLSHFHDKSLIVALLYCAEKIMSLSQVWY